MATLKDKITKNKIYTIIYISVNSWYLNKPDEDWYWPVEESQLNFNQSLQKSSRMNEWLYNTIHLFILPIGFFRINLQVCSLRIMYEIGKNYMY